MYLINNSHLVLTLDLVQGEPSLVSSGTLHWSYEKHISCYLLWQLICSAPSELGGKHIDRRSFPVLVVYMLTTFVPHMNGPGKLPLRGLFDVRMPYGEELTTCHVVLVNNASSSGEML